MVSKSTYTLVGAFVLVLGAVFIWGILWISAGGPPQDFDRYLVYMTESVSGLNVDSSLKYRGVDVGKVESISIDVENPDRIRLVLQVRRGTPVNADTVATLEYQGLTGIANINLSGGTAASAPLEPTPGEEYPVIATKPSLFARLDASMSDLLANLIHTSAAINTLLSEENQANLSRTVANAAIFSDRLAEQSSKLETLIANLDRILENAGAASADLPELTREFTSSAQALTGMADEVRQIAASLSAASAGVERTVDASGRGLVQFTGTTLPEVAAMVDDLRVASENLRRASQALAEDPSVLVYGPPEPRPGPGE